MDILSDIDIEPKLAPIKYRVSAALIDLLIFWGISFGIGYFFGEYYRNDDSVGFDLTGWPTMVLLLIQFGLIPIQEGLTGRTIGKRIVRIKVLQEDYSKSSVSASVVRHLFDVVDMFFLIGLLVASGSLKKQRIGDKIAKTIVVEE